LVDNFVERRGIIPGGRRLLNTAVDTDDANIVLRERARKALRGWRLLHQFGDQCRNQSAGNPTKDRRKEARNSDHFFA
jgi:hypothetical protein